MTYFRKKFYSWQKGVPDEVKAIYAGYDILNEHPLFSLLDGTIIEKTSHLGEKDSYACVTKTGDIYVNPKASLCCIFF